MNLQEREKRILKFGGVAAVLILLIWVLLPSEQGEVKPVGVVQSIPEAEKRLLRVRQVASTVPGKEQVLAQVSAELAQREKGLILADTAAQAQAQMVQILRRIARAQNPPINLRNAGIGQIKSFNANYGEVFVDTNFECGIDQLLNFLAELTSQSEMISTSSIRIGSAHPKQKTIPVNLTVSGLVRRELIPDGKKEAAF